MCVKHIGFRPRTGETVPLAGNEREPCLAVATPSTQVSVSILDSLRPVPGLRVLITAGAGGVGAAIARAFHTAGARVHVCDIDRSALDRLTTEVPGLTGSMADASVAADVELVFDNVQCALGGLDVLVSAAGISGPTGPIEGIDGPGWERTIAVNLHSQFYFARRAVPLLKQSPSGPSLITMGSVGGRLGRSFRTPSASSTWAVVGLMKSLAIELGPHGIRVNAILPGTVDGYRMRPPIGARATAPRVGVDEVREQCLNRISLRRMEVAALALFLCSPAARNLTGQAVSIDGNVEYL
jgi:NAD(P)-dependent dehydrogenase (short-subunit alcohol dehydrogenase family)